MSSRALSPMMEELILKVLIDATDVKISFDEAVPKGEHYFSSLYRAEVNYLRKSDEKPSKISFIIKSYPEGVMSSFMKDSGAMIREITMYKSVIPQLNEICGKKLAPLFYDCDQNDVLILEDLNFKGFVMEDRIKRMDFDHCKHAIECLADFHASSVILPTKNPSAIDEVGKEVLYTENNLYMKSFIVNCFRVIANEITKWPEGEKYAEKLRNSGETIWDMAVEAIKPPRGEISVLNHGDFWTNNILFLHNDQGDIEKVEFIDFQFCRWTTPAFDLQSFFIRSVRDREDIPALIRCYLNRFNELLRTHRVKITEKQINDHLLRTNCYGLITAVCLLPTCVRSRDEPLDYKNVTRENYDENFEIDNPYVKACKDPTYRKILPEMLEYYYNEDIL